MLILHTSSPSYCVIGQFDVHSLGYVSFLIMAGISLMKLLFLRFVVYLMDSIISYASAPLIRSGSPGDLPVYDRRP